MAAKVSCPSTVVLDLIVTAFVHLTLAVVVDATDFAALNDSEPPVEATITQGSVPVQGA